MEIDVGRVSPSGAEYRLINPADNGVVLQIQEMDLSILVQWYVALMSGLYPQGNTQLRIKAGSADNEDETVDFDRFCCLGVLSDLGVHDPTCAFTWERDSELGAYIIDQGSHDFLLKQVMDWSGLDEDASDPSIAVIEYLEGDGEPQVVTAAMANDRLDWTFEQIASCLLREIQRRVRVAA